MLTKYTPCRTWREIKARNSAELTRLRSPLRILSAKIARLQYSACRQKWGCSCWTRTHQWLQYRAPTTLVLHQEQEWNGRTVLRPIAYGSKVLSDTEMMYGAPKAEMFAVITFVEKYRAFLLRVENRALAWLKTYSMNQNYIGRWIVRLDGYHMIIDHRTRDMHQNADSR